MDGLTGLLDGVRARGAFVLRLSLDPPWAMDVRDRAPLTVLCQTRGAAVIVPETGDPVRLEAGDTAIARGVRSYVFADAPSTAPQVVIHPGQRCTTLDGTDLRFEMSVGVRTWGNSASGSHRALIGVYEGRSAVGALLLESLPELLVLRRNDWDTTLVELLADEAGQDRTGQEAVLDRLLDLVLVGALRAWFDRDPRAPRWWRASRDEVVGPAIALMHQHPGQRWTVANLAAAVGCSRAAFARRFTEAVGSPPMQFLSIWRLTLAADLLVSTRRTISDIAGEVGYSTPFAFSAAFKRLHDVSPNAYRRAVE